MSRLYQEKIKIPVGVTALIKEEKNEIEIRKDNFIKQYKFHHSVHLTLNQDEIEIKGKFAYDKSSFNMHRTTVSIILSNLFQGFFTPFVKELKLVGVGYKAQLEKNNLTLLVAYCHPILLAIPHSVNIQLLSATQIKLSSCDKEMLGTIADQIRRIRIPELYKGIGIRYTDEIIKLKAAKKK
jgi:large subunit ribosomal protein L6